MRISVVVSLYLFATIFFLSASESLLAQRKTFSEIRIAPAGYTHFGKTHFTKRWEPNKGLGFDISTDYYSGAFEMGLRVFRYNELAFENSGFYSHYVFAGWRYRYAAAENVYLSPGFRLGNNFMLHDEDKFYDDYRFSRDESEFSYEVFLRLEYDFHEYAGFYIASAYNRTLFNTPQSSLYGSLGLVLRIKSPDWWKSFMQ